MLTETLVADVEIPKINPQIVSGYIRLAVRINGNGVDVISMCIRINFPWDRGDDVILTNDRW